jgi:hypothetical protein
VIACQQMAIGSSFLANLNAGDDTIGNVDYTNIASAFDEIVTPYWNAFLNNDGNNHNVLIQAPCFLRVVDHIGLPLDGSVYSGIQDALAHRPISLNCFAL